MLERFTESAKGVLAEARDLALELGSPAIGPIHLLYGCAEVRDETAGVPLRELGITRATIRGLLPRQEEEQGAGAVDADALRAIGIDYEAIRAAVEQNFGPGALDAAPDRRVPSGLRKPPFTPEAKLALELALRNSLQVKAERIAPGHLVLGLIRLEDELVVAAIEAPGTTVAHVWAAVNASLWTAAGGRGRPPRPSRTP